MSIDQQKIREIKRKHESRWLSIKGVVGVGIGILTDKNLGIIISVTKMDEQISKRIPPEVEGIKLEIRETGEFKAL